MSIISFAQVISPLGQGVGFPGTISRSGSKRVVKAHQVLPTTTNPLYFGGIAILIPDGYNGTVQPVADFIAGASQTTAQGVTVNTSAIVPLTGSSLAGIFVGQTVTGTGVPGSTTVLSMS